MANTVSARVSEEKLQSDCYRWFHNTFPLWRRMLFHVDNNSWNPIIGAKKKALGVNAGVSDIVLILFAETIWIEMKTQNGTQSDEQIDFQSKVEARLHKYYLVRSLAEFQELVTTKIRQSNEYLALANGS